jgi:phosphopantothenoylcysteine decarboxylase/phosphopantothenate--cysteine ligase
VRVLLGVTGGIAAYKSAEIVRRLRGRGHEVRCALTRGAVSFVSPLTLEVLSGHAVWQEEYMTATGTGEEAHITAAAWADVLCIAPATANVLGRLALGLADDFLTTTALAFAGPVVVAPAMHSIMWDKPAVQENVETLRHRGVRIVGPIEGPLASGEVGMGRMADPETITAAVEEVGLPGPLTGRTVLVTAGPTYEPVDPVRFIGNRSSGKMGFSLADEAPRAVLVGFAAETGDLEANALAKLERKGADYLVANDVSRKDIAFDSDANEVTVYRPTGDPVFFPRQSKSALSGALLDLFGSTLSRS